MVALGGSPRELWKWLTRRGAARGPALGLDIGHAAIKLVELGPSGAKHLIQDLPATDEQEPAAPKQLAAWLPSALKEFRTTQVRLAIAGPEVVIRRLDVPPMSARELREAVRWQLKDELPFPVQEAVLDCRVVGEVWDKDIRKQDVLVAAAPRGLVQELVQAVERCGVQVVRVTPAPLALWHGIQARSPGWVSGSLALVEIGSQATHVTVVKDGQVRVTRDLNIGSRSMTEALVGVVASDQGERTIDLPMAEALKRRYGVLADDATGLSEEGIPLFHIASLMPPVLEQVLTDVSRFLDYYRMHTDPAGVSRVVLCGGGASLKGLREFLAEGLGVPVEVWNPLVGIAAAGDQEQLAEDGPRLAVAFGAAGDGPAMNLLPPATSAAKGSMTGGRLPAIARVVAVALAALVIGLQAAALSLRAMTARQQAAWQQLEPQYRAEMETAAREQAVAQTVAGIERFLATQPVWDGLLKSLATATPTGIELDGVDVLGGSAEASPRVHVRGRVAAADHSSVGAFVAALERSPFFADVGLASSELRSTEPSRGRFDIEAGLE